MSNSSTGTLAEATAGYTDDEVPLRDYAGLVAGFPLAFGLALAAGARRGRPIPERIALRDLLLVGVATHKVSRLVTKSKATGALRAPFTRLQGPAGHGEVEEAARGTGPRRVLGELLVCPYCLGQWIGGGFAAGLVIAPRTTRLIAGMFSATALSDFLQLAYAAAARRA